MGNLLVRLSADEETATVYHISTASDVLQIIKRFTGISLEGYALKRKYWQKLAENYFFRGKALFINDPYEFTSLVIPNMPTKLLRKAITLGEGHTKDKAAYLPLMEGKHAHGILGVWGIDLREEDLPALNVFTSQVSAALKSAEEIENEREETSKVTRANKFITVLNQVAVRLQSTSDPDEILALLASGLTKLNIAFMLTTLEKDKKTLTIRYTSMKKKWLGIAEKIMRRKLIGFPLREENFPSSAEIVTSKKSIIIEDALQAALVGVSAITKFSLDKLEPSVRALFDRANWNTISIWHPLIIDDKVIGTINFWGENLLKEDLPILTIFSNQIATSLENARLYANERQRTAELETSLEEKSVLLKEVHHRVKNNLQIISSLLNLQTASISNQEILDMFSESRDRIRSMALVHEKLYQSEDLAQIDFGEYIRGLSTQLMQSYAAAARNIELELDIQNIHLSIDQAVPCGLIINEIITNSIKHAFPEQQKGKIIISLHKEPNRQVKLVAQDNGIGIPLAVSLDNPSTLGMQIISLLTQQINGKITILRKRGASFKIVF